MTTQLLVTSSYAALLAFVFVYLSFRTLRLRGSLKIPMSDGDNPQMLRAIRVHANFAEYVPMCLLLMLLMELRGAAPLLLHALGIALILGRILHARGVSQIHENMRWRLWGMRLTLGVLITSASYLLFSQIL